MLVSSALSTLTSQTLVEEGLALAESSESQIVLKLFRFIIENVRFKAAFCGFWPPDDTALRLQELHLLGNWSDVSGATMFTLLCCSFAACLDINVVDDSHSWSTALDGYKLFRRDRKRRRGGGVVLYIKKAFDAMDIKTNEDGVECLWDNCPGLVDGVREHNGPPIIQEEAVTELLRCLDIHKSMGPDGIHHRLMRELADELAKPLSIIYSQLWLTGEVLDDWKLASVTPIHKKSGKEEPSNYRPVSLTSVPGKITEQFILSVITKHLQDGQGLRPSQHRFRRGRSCLTNLISFYDQVTHLVDAGRAVDVVYLDFSKAFDTVSHSTLLDKLASLGLDRSTLCWVRNWLDGWAREWW
ncbi:hypothetical protein HGM15179_001358 [Zosterops borbonicus]|uniref:Reverse transcriptase domain-containing protein n=1 Tax=Zosterops borbonicus TaxID=364589 RepID=A0A8K1LTR8_9PASS|nr:hypothetical protein HGM15179_001358 [Zosterops borbonicus]